MRTAQLRHAFCLGTAAVALSGGVVLLTGGAALADGCTGLVGCLGRNVGDTLGAVGDGDLTGVLDGVGETVGGTVDGTGEIVDDTLNGVGRTVGGTVDGVGETVHDTVGALGKRGGAPGDDPQGGTATGDDSGGHADAGTAAGDTACGDDAGTSGDAGSSGSSGSGQGAQHPSGGTQETAIVPRQHGQSRPAAPAPGDHEHRGHLAAGHRTRVGNGVAHLGLLQWLDHSLPSGMGTAPGPSSLPPLPGVAPPPVIAADPTRHVAAPRVAPVVPVAPHDGSTYLAALATGNQAAALTTGNQPEPGPAVLLATILVGGSGVAYLSVYRRRRRSTRSTPA